MCSASAPASALMLSCFNDLFSASPAPMYVATSFVRVHSEISKTAKELLFKESDTALKSCEIVCTEINLWSLNILNW